MIRKIKWNNYRGLGNLELDFMKDEKAVYSTIILAGENGTGKTTILDTLSDFLDFGSIRPFEYIEYDTPKSIYTVREIPQHNMDNYYSRTDKSTGATEQIIRVKGDLLPTRNDAEDIRHFGFAYSKARSGFNTKKITSTSTSQLDHSEFNPDSSEDFTSIKQLLVDIDEQDSAEWRKQSEISAAAKRLCPSEFEQFEMMSRMHRFRSAFNDFFDGLEFNKIDYDNPSEKAILFTKHGVDISVDLLSTGEKQIVFRGAHLLRNANSVKGGFIFIDEPELSMHPLWQQKILKYYRDLFTANGKQTVQMFFATHSEYVIESALSDPDTLVIILKDNNGVIESKRMNAPEFLPQITAAEVNYQAFNIASVDLHIALYGYLQQNVQGKTTIACDDYIKNQTEYDPILHEKIDPLPWGKRQAETLPTYIRNAIDHPHPQRSYSQEELRTSIELLIKLCKNFLPKPAGVSPNGGSTP